SQAAAQLGVPLRGYSPLVQYRGDFYGQSGKGYPVPEAITTGALLELLAALPAGLTELGCHPGEPDNLETMYRDERLQEVQTLCVPLVRRALQSGGLRLSSFHDLAACR